MYTIHYFMLSLLDPFNINYFYVNGCFAFQISSKTPLKRIDVMLL